MTQYTTEQLQAEYEPTDEAFWEKHKDCTLAKRDHKWQWLLDISSGQPHPTAAICVHCGVQTHLTRNESRGVAP